MSTTDRRTDNGQPQRFVDTRGRIVAAAGAVIRERGLAHATTNQIALAAGCSEALIYKHFREKEELLLAVLADQIRPFVELIGTLPDRAGTATVAEHLTSVAHRLIADLIEAAPLALGLFAEPELQARHRSELIRAGAGPQLANSQLTKYLEAEGALGRVRAGADTKTIADMVIGACFQRAYLLAFVGEPSLGRPTDSFVDDLVRVSLDALS